jgi:DNA-binding response OmpR family regulator
MTASRSVPASRRVLVVEDEAPLCEMLEEYLSGCGWNVVCAPDDATAYRALARGGFSMLVADINLGVGTTGFDVARYARRLYPELPVIYITGGDEHSVARHAVSDGMLVPKPFHPSELVERLEAGPAA